MKIPFRSLLILIDSDSDSELRELTVAKYSEPDHVEIIQAFRKRVDRVLDLCHHQDSLLFHEQEKWDANILANFLDGQLSEEETEIQEARLENSDPLLAELLDVYFLMNHTLLRPAQTSLKCRERVYAIESPDSSNDGHSTLKFQRNIQSQNVSQPEPAHHIDKINQVDETNRIDMIFPKSDSVSVDDFSSQIEAAAYFQMEKNHFNEKKRVQDSLKEWKAGRHSRMKYIAAATFFLAICSLLWNHRDEVHSFWNDGSEKQQTQLSTHSPSEIAPKSLSENSSDIHSASENILNTDDDLWNRKRNRERTESLLYSHVEPPDSVIKKADPPQRLRNRGNYEAKAGHYNEIQPAAFLDKIPQE